MPNLICPHPFRRPIPENTGKSRLWNRWNR
nr:MAG TPA: hypothetical protein [Caudoviricetes sp.]DAN94396.1 MAG TPA: hypothetical protein [Caudoviricetes sp.]